MKATVLFSTLADILTTYLFILISEWSIHCLYYVHLENTRKAKYGLDEKIHLKTR